MCPQFSVSPVFVMDHTDREAPEIFLVEQGTSSIWGVDLDGCQCRLIINGSADIDDGKMEHRDESGVGEVNGWIIDLCTIPFNTL